MDRVIMNYMSRQRYLFVPGLLSHPHGTPRYDDKKCGSVGLGCLLGKQ